MADRRDPADRLARSSPDVFRCCPAQRGHTQQGGAPFGIYPVCSARHDQERASLSVENEAVRYRPDVNTKVVGRLGRGRDTFREHVNLTLNTKSGEGISDILSIRMQLRRMTFIQRRTTSLISSVMWRPEVGAVDGTFDWVYSAGSPRNWAMALRRFLLVYCRPPTCWTAHPLPSGSLK